MRRSSFIFLALFALTACGGFKYPELRSNEGVKMLKMDGRNLTFEAKAVVFNPNGFSLKVKPSTVRVALEGQDMGSVQLSQKLKLKRKSSDTLTIPFNVELAEGAMLTMLRYMVRDSVKVKITGKVKGGIGFISKKQKIDFERSIPGRMLRFKP
jgi:LEA14-like dessication related protein